MAENRKPKAFDTSFYYSINMGKFKRNNSVGQQKRDNRPEELHPPKPEVSNPVACVPNADVRTRTSSPSPSPACDRTPASRGAARHKKQRRQMAKAQIASAQAILSPAQVDSNGPIDPPAPLAKPEKKTVEAEPERKKTYSELVEPSLGYIGLEDRKDVDFSLVLPNEKKMAELGSQTRVINDRTIQMTRQIKEHFGVKQYTRETRIISAGVDSTLWTDVIRSTAGAAGLVSTGIVAATSHLMANRDVRTREETVLDYVIGASAVSSAATTMWYGAVALDKYLHTWWEAREARKRRIFIPLPNHAPNNVHPILSRLNYRYECFLKAQSACSESIDWNSDDNAIRRYLTDRRRHKSVGYRGRRGWFSWKYDGFACAEIKSFSGLIEDLLEDDNDLGECELDHTMVDDFSLYAVGGHVQADYQAGANRPLVATPHVVRYAVVDVLVVPTWNKIADDRGASRMEYIPLSRPQEVFVSLTAALGAGSADVSKCDSPKALRSLAGVRVADALKSSNIPAYWDARVSSGTAVYVENMWYTRWQEAKGLFIGPEPEGSQRGPNSSFH